MADRILVDTGPLVAVFRENEAHREACLVELHRLSDPLLVCWPVLTEASHLLRKNQNAVRALLGWFDQGILALANLDENAPPWIAAFYERYHDQAPDLADAALMYLVERDGINTVFTLDRKDFTVYRKRDKQPVRLIPEL